MVAPAAEAAIIDNIITAVSGKLRLQRNTPSPVQAGHMDAAFDGHLVQRLTLTLGAR